MVRNDTQTERLGALEKQVLMMKRAALALGVLAASIVVMGQTASVDGTVEATKFVLRDGGGSIRASLAMTARGPAFTLLDAKGTERVALWLHDDTPTLIMSKGSSSAGLGVDARGPDLQFVDGAGVRAELAIAGARASDSPGLAFFDASRGVQWQAPGAASSGGVGEVCVESSQPTADVYVDGKLVGSAPSLLRLSAGEHFIQATAPGQGTWERRIQVIVGSNLLLRAYGPMPVFDTVRKCPGR
jgi:hypothetical protein